MITVLYIRFARRLENRNEGRSDSGESSPGISMARPESKRQAKRMNSFVQMIRPNIAGEGHRPLFTERCARFRLLTRNFRSHSE